MSKAAALAAVVAPGVSTCALAGAAGVSWSMFGGVTLVGALLRLWRLEPSRSKYPWASGTSAGPSTRDRGRGGGLTARSSRRCAWTEHKEVTCWATSPGPGLGRDGCTAGRPHHTKEDEGEERRCY